MTFESILFLDFDAWRDRYSLDDMRERFSLDFHGRVIDRIQIP